MADSFDDDMFIQASQQYETLSKQSVEDFEKKDSSDGNDLLVEASQQYKVFHEHAYELDDDDDNDLLVKASQQYEQSVKVLLLKSRHFVTRTLNSI